MKNLDTLPTLGAQDTEGRQTKENNFYVASNVKSPLQIFDCHLHELVDRCEISNDQMTIDIFSFCVDVFLYHRQDVYRTLQCE
jgi:hypothetical protein